MAKYEAHITCDRADATLVESVGSDQGWKFSQIDGGRADGAESVLLLDRLSS